MKSNKSLIFALVLFSITSFDAYSAGGRQKPPERSYVETVQIFFAELFNIEK